MGWDWRTQPCEAVAHRRRAGLGPAIVMLRDRSIEIDEPLIGELQHRRGGQGLGDRVGIERRVEADRALRVWIGEASVVGKKEFVGRSKDVLKARRLAAIDHGIEHAPRCLLWAGDCTREHGFDFRRVRAHVMSFEPWPTHGIGKAATKTASP